MGTGHDQTEFGAFLSGEPGAADVFAKIIDIVRPLADGEIVPGLLFDLAALGFQFFDDP